MSKYGIGVGEEFPVDEPANPSPPESDDDRRKRRSRRRGYSFLHVITRIVLITLVISAIACLFGPHYYYPDSFAPYRSYPYPYYPYPHHFYFPFFSVLLVVVLIAFAWRYGGCYVMPRHRHDEPHDDRREGT